MSETPVALVESVRKRHAELYEAFIHGKLDLHASARARIEEALQVVAARLGQVRPTWRGENAELWALCPFHDDTRVGSFSVDSATGNYYCWVCGAHGGLVALLKHFNLWDSSMRHTLSGVDLKALRDAALNRRSAVGVEEMTPLPEALLSVMKGMTPRRYLSRGHSRAILRSMEVNVDPLQMRVCFPVRSAQGSLVGIQSRLAFDHQIGIRWKWYRHELADLGQGVLDSGWVDTYLPPRRTVLYNEHRVLQPLARGDLAEVVLVEGQGHLLRVLAAGYPALSSFGTQLAPAQSLRLIEALRRGADALGHKPRVILFQDGDLPGRSSALHAYLTLSHYADCRFVPLEDGSDPEELTPAEVRQRLSAPFTFLELFDSPWRDRYMDGFAALSASKSKRPGVSPGVYRGER